MASSESLTMNASLVNEHTHQAMRADVIYLFGDSSAETLTATTTGDWVDVGYGANLDLTAVLTNVSGTNPTIDITIQTSSDKGVNDTARAVNSLSTAGAFAQFTAAGTKYKAFGPTSRYVRAVVTIGGTTPSADVIVSGRVG